MTDQLGIFTDHVQPTGDNAVPVEAGDRPYDYYTEGPFTCAGCGGEILRGEPHSRQSPKKGAVIDSGLAQGPQNYVRKHFCCHADSCLYAAYLQGQRDKPCDCAHVTNVGWWPCSQCGVAHGGHCPSPDAELPPWPPPGWRDAETGRASVDRRRQVERHRLGFASRPQAVAGQRRAARRPR